MDKEQLSLEEKYLKKVINEIKKQREALKQQQLAIENQKKELSKKYADDFYEMDDEEALLEGDRLAEFDNLNQFLEKGIVRLNRQEYSPYFGRVDFATRNQKPKSYYIGVNNLVKDGAITPLVCDWRAPVSSLFYDHEIGQASYTAPDGVFEGEISLKRQYEIKGGKLKNVFDSSLTIEDEILKDVLSQNTSLKMRTIINTIQKEQNQIIRANMNKSMLVQGVAGSGKTSIALHRIAYLLYHNKKTLKAQDVLILSPNKLFAEYIAEVLPELGEENMSQMSFYRLAQEELAFLGLDIEKREDNLEEVCASKQRLNEVAYKNSYEFFESLQNFCKEFFNIAFKPSDLKFGTLTITADEMKQLYNKTYQSKKPAIRIEWLVDYIVDKMNLTKNIAEISKKIKGLLYPFFLETNVLNIYAQFLSSIGMHFSLNKDEQIRYDDLGAILYIANYFFGLEKYKEVKYLIVDEMQDYSFATYAVLNDIFDCNKTILGDINQCIEKVANKQDLQILAEMTNSCFLELNKAYRSTFEITQFANKIKNIDAECFERHGEKPSILKTEDINKSVAEILSNNQNYNQIAILTKSIKEAKELYQALNLEGVSLNINYDDEIAKTCIMPAYMAKGLEFDVVIIPNYNQTNYKTTLDFNMLYVSITRALHKLYLIDNK